MLNDIQRLTDFMLIPNEYKIININAVSQAGDSRTITNFTPTLKVYQYGNRDAVLFTVNGVKSDSDKCSFTIPSSETVKWKGKLEYIITLAYTNGNEVKGLGYITMK